MICVPDYVQCFNPRSHEGSDTGKSGKTFGTCCFNPRSHEGSDWECFGKKSVGFWFQSTLPRGERPCNHQVLCVLCSVSIHAPTRGATKTGLQIWRNTQVSIHAPTRGATTCSDNVLNLLHWFQSTLPRGERLSSTRQVLLSACFNPRSHEGSDSNFAQKSSVFSVEINIFFFPIN